MRYEAATCQPRISAGTCAGLCPSSLLTDPQMSQTGDSSRAEYLCDTAVLQERTDLPLSVLDARAVGAAAEAGRAESVIPARYGAVVPRQFRRQPGFDPTAWPGLDADGCGMRDRRKPRA